MNTRKGFTETRAVASSGSAACCSAAIRSPLAISEISYPTHVEMGTRAATGAAVESTR